MALVDLQEKANFARLSRLLVDKGTEALRNTFDTIHPPASLPRVLTANKTSLLRLKPRIINKLQWDLLFPPSGNPPDSKTFDVTLLTVLFRNICGFPSTGWGVMPPDTDRSKQANIARIKWLRNDVYAHVTSTKIDSSTFESLWTKISQALVELGISQGDIDDLKTCPLVPEEKVYVQSLKDWKLHEDECITLLGGIECSVNRLTKITEELRQSTLEQKNTKNVPQRSIISDEDLLRKLAKHNFKGKIRSKVKFFEHKTRNWLLKQVDEWFCKSDNDSRILLVTAEPGFGKSVFAAKICEDFEENGILAACHFCDLNSSNLRDPMMMLQSLASQMCDNMPGFKEKLVDQLKRPHQVQSLKDAFLIYLQNPLDELDFDEPKLVVIDGLHESAADDQNEIMNLIADYFSALPEFVKILVTSRPEISVTKLSGVQKIAASDDRKNNWDIVKADLNSEVQTKQDVKDDSRNLRNELVYADNEPSKEEDKIPTNSQVFKIQLRYSGCNSVSAESDGSSGREFYFNYQEPRGRSPAQDYSSQPPPSNDTNSQVSGGSCPICDRFFSNIDKLQAHVDECLESESTEPIGGNICPICQGSFSDMHTFQVHVSECLDDSNIKRQTKQPKAKKTKSVRKNLCQKCQRSFPDSGALQAHVMKCTKDDKRARKQAKFETTDSVGGFICKHCQASLPDWGTHLNHVIQCSMHTEMQRQLKKTKTTDSVGKYKCDLCQATFPDWETHLEHVTGGDLDPSDMIWKCPGGGFKNTKKKKKQPKFGTTESKYSSSDSEDTEDSDDN